MRGHWVSTTRKLNKHYQSSGGGSTDPNFGLFSCVAYSASGQWAHGSAGTGNNWYNDGYSYSYSTSQYKDNYVRMIKYRGYRYSQYDGCFEVGARPSGIPEVDNNFLNCGGVAGDIYSPIVSSDVGEMADTGPYTLGTGLLYKDYGIKYARLHCPKYMFGPGYWKNGGEIDPNTDLPPGAYSYENLWKLDSVSKVYNGIELNAYDTVRLSLIGSSSRSQLIRITQNYTRNGQPYTLQRNIFNSGVTVFNIYDNMEAVGVCELTGNVNLYRDNIYGSTVTLAWKLYCFFWQGDFYFSTHPELTLDGVDVTEDYDIFIDKYWFPSRLGGYPRRGAFASSECPDFKMWLDYQSGQQTAANAWLFNTSSQVSYKAPYAVDYELYYPRIVHPYLRMYQLTEEEFFDTMADWQRAHT